MCADWFNTFQAFYIYVKETRFTIIGKVNVQSESSSIMNARRLQELGCRFEISGARFERPMMKDTWQLLNVFIMVCSWDLIMVGFTEKFWAWKPESDGGNRLSFVAVIDGPANVCGMGTFVFTGASGATVVVMSETAIRFFSALGFSSFRLDIALESRRCSSSSASS